MSHIWLGLMDNKFITGKNYKCCRTFYSIEMNQNITETQIIEHFIWYFTIVTLSEETVKLD